MSPQIAIATFIVCLAVTLVASELLVRGVDSLAAFLGLSEGLIGLLTAFGADVPEISSAIAAIHSGARDIGLGIVIGSNIFNVAALLGLGAVLAGHIRVHREGLILNGGISLIITSLGICLILDVFPAVLTVALMVTVMITYISVLGMRPRRVASLPGLGTFGRALAIAISEVDHEVAVDPRVGTAQPTKLFMMLIPVTLAGIGASSFGLVSSTLTLVDIWHLPRGFIGTIVLAGLTSLPNAYAAARLSLQRRGAAVVSETLNSNTINIVAGIAAPMLIFSHMSTPSHSVIVDIVWLVALTLVSLVLLRHRRGLTRTGGGLIIAMYLFFIVLHTSMTVG